ncbi:class II aldolase adducin domain protein [Coniophora puteana RWD-64-598 SS2]|uniref:Class II aldolase adducin domain protein n=1 Tax=Coniophora puteana (strain RWD-64-598) TaxID=741705 RepID=A0A5M3M9W2_CONPW|nr:class II aldolase adducin domain protein [Coniophora puteana RWD-64-598 SS2]EIW75580.1 class II aldolase adducin domain protein [Coniophora puteana RWD-64-598 SS2]
MSNQQTRITDAEFDVQSASSLEHAPRPPSFASKEEEREWVKFRLAQSFRLFAKWGYDEGLAGHITVRDPIKPECFWVNPWGPHFATIQPSDLLLVDHHGSVLAAESGPNHFLNKAAYLIHAAIHAARPDALCAAHSHSIHGKAYGTLGLPLDPITQDSLAFFEDHVVFKQYEGVVGAEKEAASIAQALGGNKAAILQNHGIVTVGRSIESAVHFFHSMERSCRVQMLADAAAAARGVSTQKIPATEARSSAALVGSERAGWLNGYVEFGRFEAEEGVKFKGGK